MSDLSGFIVVALMLCVFAFGAAFVCASLPDEDTGARLLTKQGFTQVQYTGRSPLATLHGCSEQDVALLHYDAINPAGQPVNMDVCIGWPLKGATIRE
jgi:hypothetical protein